MKKFFSFIVVLMFVGTGFSQHIDVVNQTGISNDSKVVQKFNEQWSTNLARHEAYVDQIGNYNKSDVFQNKTSYSNVPGLADVYQEGTYNDSKVSQNGWESRAWVTEVGHNNKSDVFQWSGKSTATVYQVGDWNDAKVTISNYDPSSFNLTYGTISQFGIANKSYQTIGENDAHKVHSSSFVSYQQGNYNESNQTLYGGGVDYLGLNTYNNHGIVTQYGTYNNSEQVMDMDTPNFYARNNSASLYQNGNNNISDQFMKRNDNSSVVTQVGNWNTSVSQQNW